MVTISGVVNNIMNNQIFLQEALKKEIVSYNKLAKTLKPKIEKKLNKKIQNNAVVMALRRYNCKQIKKQNNISNCYFKETLLKSNLCYIILEESSSSLNKIQSIYNKIQNKKSTMFIIIHGNYEIGVITNISNKKKILNKLKDEKILIIVEDLVAVSFVYTDDFLFTPCIIYNVIRLIAWENINIINMTFTLRELNIVVLEKDALRTYEVLENLVKISKNDN
jgi:hypothetical protein